MYDRDFRTAGVGGRARLGQRTSVAAGYVDKAFGANGFYGPAPSKEWTGQTLVSAEHTMTPAAGWATAVRASYRTHSDRFLYDIRTPQLFENRHRTHAALVAGGTDRELGSGRLHLGAEGGEDWIRSTNLGDHDVAHGSAVAEYQYRPGARTTIVSGLRFDGYSRYGSSWNPSVNASVWTTSSIKLRASAGHTFRIPTFTELYYHDPANQARDDLQPERGWSWDAGADWLPAAAWMASATAFVRHDQDIIDWVRDSTAERWHTANVRRLDTAGIELGVRRMVGKGGSLDAQYAWLHSDADPVAQLSKYVLDYAPQRFVVSAAIPISEKMTFGGRLGTHAAPTDANTHSPTCASLVPSGAFACSWRGTTCSTPSTRRCSGWTCRGVPRARGSSFFVSRSVGDALARTGRRPPTGANGPRPECRFRPGGDGDHPARTGRAGPRAPLAPRRRDRRHPVHDAVRLLHVGDVALVVAGRSARRLAGHQRGICARRGRGARARDSRLALDDCGHGHLRLRARAGPPDDELLDRPDESRP